MGKNQPPGVMAGEQIKNGGGSLLPTFNKGGLAAFNAERARNMPPSTRELPVAPSMRGLPVASSVRGGTMPVGSFSKFPRQSSSMVTTSTEGSHAEMQSLIRPPVAIY